MTTIEQLNLILQDKEKRLEIYKAAYKLHLSYIEKSKYLGYPVHGICNDICNAIRHVRDSYPLNFQAKELYLPEFHSLKPKDARIYWWNSTDYEIRKEIYEKHLINI